MLQLVVGYSAIMSAAGTRQTRISFPLASISFDGCLGLVLLGLGIERPKFGSDRWVSRTGNIGLASQARVPLSYMLGAPQLEGLAVIAHLD
jgi:hypothetical protein